MEYCRVVDEVTDNCSVLTVPKQYDRRGITSPAYIKILNFHGLKTCYFYLQTVKTKLLK